MQVCGRCQRQKDESDFSPSYRGRKGTWCRACFADYNRQRSHGVKPPESVPPKRQTRTCAYCGELYAPRQDRTSSFCSRSCKGRARNAAGRAALIASKPTRACVHCTAPIPQTMRADAKFCSQECNDAAHAITRKLAKRAGVDRSGELLSRAYTAERDKFRCHLCGGKVSMLRKHPDPLSPSVDHAVPVSQGGTNELSNLRLAHLRCNLSKGDGARGEQLLLIG